MEYCSAVWIFDDSASGYSSHTIEAETVAGTAFDFLGETADYYYFGFSREMRGLAFDIATAGSYGAMTWEYTDDSTDADSWTRLVPIMDYAFTADKYVMLRPPSDWASVAFSSTKPHNGDTPPDLTARYWLRVSTASVTTVATINQIICIPEVIYTTISGVNSFMQLKTAFSSSTLPTSAQVTSYIREAEGEIDRKTHRSWRWNRSGDFTQDGEYEYYAYNQYGLTLQHRDIIKMYGLSLWNGSGWNALTEGKGSDYWVHNYEGMIYMARLYVPPVAYGITRSMYGWEYGEFKLPFRTTYTWGQDSTVAYDFNMVHQTANMMVAIMVATSNDYSKLVTRGVDNVPLYEKIRLWEDKIEANIEALAAWVVG